MLDSDAEMLKRYVRDGAGDAFAVVVRRHLNLVYGAAWRRTGDSHLAEEVTQAVFTAMAREASSLTRHTVLTGWLYTTTRYCASRLLRAEHRRRNREQEAYKMHTTYDALSCEDHIWEQTRPMIDAALDELPERDREAVLLRFFEGRAFTEMGVILQLTDDAARMRVERALERLHGGLTRRGVKSTVAALGVGLSHHAAAVVAPKALAGSVVTAVLAGATTVGAAAGGLGFLTIMSTSKWMMGTALLVSAAGLGTALCQTASVRAAGHALAATRVERDELRIQLGESQAQLRTGDDRITGLEKQIAARGATPPAGAAVSPGLPGADPMLSDPEYFKISLEQYRLSLGRLYSPLYNALGLTTEQITRFEANRVQYQQSLMELMSSAASQEISMSNPGVLKLAADNLTPWESELKTILGNDGFRRYQQYGREKPARDFVLSLAGSVYQTETPLNAHQGDQLERILAANMKKVVTGKNSAVYQADWTSIAEQAGGLLSGSQQAIFNSLVEEKKLQERITALTSTARSARPAKP